MRKRLGIAAVVFASALVGVTAQQSNCASCHAAQQGPAFDPQYTPYTLLTERDRIHLYDWEDSAHGRNNVGCEACHGGNPTTFERLQAHAGVLTSGNPASPVYRTNLPGTCGRCHAGAYVAFQRSHHYSMLQQGDQRGPVCTTCHGSVDARLLSPRSLERQCAHCHGPEGPVPLPGRAENARELLESIDAVRASLDAARHLLDNVTDDERRGRLEEAYQQAEVPVIEAADSAHEFVFDTPRERLSVARQRTAALLEELVNPR